MDQYQTTNQVNTRSTNWILIGGLALIVILLAIGSLIYLTKTEKQQPGKVTTPPKVVTEAVVSITEEGFSPATIQITKGSAVRWTNTDSSPHQIASDPHPTNTSLPGLYSDPLAEGDSYSYTFEKSGTYTYHDHLNPLKFKGTVIVK